MTQRDEVLELLQQAGPGGVNSYALTYAYGIKQAPTRIKELKESGHNISSIPQKDRSVQYILHPFASDSKPFMWDFSNGNARKVYV